MTTQAPQQMTFEEDFPSLKGKISQMKCPHCGQWTGFAISDVQEHCLDKAKVKEAILKELK